MQETPIPPPGGQPPYPPPAVAGGGYPDPSGMFDPYGLPAAAELHPEHRTDEAVENSRRKSKLTALFMAIGIHVVVLLLITLIVVSRYDSDIPQIVAVQGSDTVSEDLAKTTFTPIQRRTPSASSSKISQVIAAATQAPTAVPVVEDIVDDPLEFGVSIGDDIGMNPFGDGGGFGSFIPASMSSRCTSKDRAQRLAESGGKPEAEEAVVKGLRWFAKNQNEDGSFGNTNHKAAMTGLVLLAFLGHCETPDSKEFGDNVLNAILWMVELGVNQNGRLTTKGNAQQWVYDHGIATYALSEAYSITKYGKRRIPRIRQVLEMAVPLIIQGQQQGGGWDYGYSKGDRVDMSVAGWQIQALKAAQHSKIPIAGLNEAMDLAMTFVRGMQGPSGGFGYNGPEDKISLAGAGALALIMGTGQSRSREVRKAVEFINDSTDHNYKGSALSDSLYGWYYNTQACFQAGGSSWTKWNRGFQKELLKYQNEDGSWSEDAPGLADHVTSRGAAGDAVIYRTALAVLCLEVYYRYLPATETKSPSGLDKSGLF